MDKSSKAFVGMDVHKESIDWAVAELDGEAPTILEDVPEDPRAPNERLGLCPCAECVGGCDSEAEGDALCAPNLFAFPWPEPVIAVQFFVP